MNTNEKFVITINRELGSGGRTVGRKLAEKLGVAFYDKAVVKALGEKYGFSVDEIEKLKGESHGKWIDIKRVVDGVLKTDRIFQVNAGEEVAQDTTDEMFRTETELLKAIAEEESCVVAGRSGFHVFRDHPNHLSILIQASMPFRVKRIMRKQNISEDEARKTIEKVDQMRENYVKEYTNTSRYDTRNYDLVISMDHLSEDAAAEAIIEFINRMSL
jgi:cytidylate kinase